MVMEMVSLCIEDMKMKGNPQWDETYPTREILENDIDTESLFIIKESQKIIAICALTYNEEPQYRDIAWMDKEGQALEIHRIAVSPKWQNRRIAKKLFDFAEKYAQSKGYSSMRLDTLCKNRRMRKLIELRGYSQTGEIFFPPITLPFYCYEKVFGKEN